MSEIKVIKLNADGWDFGITAEGKRVVWCDYESEPVLRRIPEKDIQGGYILHASSFPVGPYCNRIDQGRAEFYGTQVNLKPNLLERDGTVLDPSSMIGLGWTHNWNLITQTHNTVLFELRYEPESGEWPWSCTMTQRFTFAHNTMTVRTTLRNDEETRSMPGGLGAHVYFHREPGTRIFAQVDQIWEMDGGKIPKGGLIAVPVNQTFAPAKGGLAVDEHELDQCYPLPDGRFSVVRPNMKHGTCIVQSDEQTRQMIVYVTQKDSPSGPPGTVLVAYPNTHVNDGINLMRTRGDTGVRVLRPNECMASNSVFTMELS